MRPPFVSRRTHEQGLQEARREVVEGLSEGQREAAEALLRGNEERLKDLALRVPGFLVPSGPIGDSREDLAAARELFRSPIARVEASAKDRFRSVAAQVGITKNSAKHRRERYWSSYFNFNPSNNRNTTNPIPVADTAAGTLAIELGTDWGLTPSRHRRHKSSETAFFARVLSTTDEADDPQEIGYVRLGRIFSVVDLENDSINRGNRRLDYGEIPDTSGYPGRFVLGGHAELERDFISSVREQSDPSAQAATLTRVEQAAAAFTVLSECAAVQAGVETHAVDADALSLAISTVQRP